MKSLKSLNVVGLLALTFVVGCTPANKEQTNTVAVQPNTSIIGGTQVGKDDPIAKSTVGLIGVIYENKQAIGQYGCTGSLIAQNLVLTAGHCLPTVKKGQQAALIVVFTRDMQTATKNDIRYVVDAIQHPEYALGNEDEEESATVNRDAEPVTAADTKAQAQQTQEDSAPKNGHDFAVIKFQGALPEGYQVANILTDESLLTEGKVVTLAGFGLTDGVNKTNDDKMNKVQVEVIEHYGNEVVLDQSKGKGACHGDSGGPAFLEVNGVQYLWGVTSRGIGKDGKDDCSLFSVYGKVFSQKDFITKAIKALNGTKN